MKVTHVFSSPMLFLIPARSYRAGHPRPPGTRVGSAPPVGSFPWLILAPSHFRTRGRVFALPCREDPADVP